MERSSAGALLTLALALGACVSSDTAAPVAHVLPFIEDDYPRALAEARERQVPLFVEAWAPW